MSAPGDDYELLARWLAGDLTPEESARVEARLIVEPELCRVRDALTGLDQAAAELPRTTLSDAEIDALVQRALPAARPRRTSAPFALAAVLLVGVAWWLSTGDETRVTADRDTVIVDGTTLVAGEFVSGAEQVELTESGAARVRLREGALWLGGPASLKLARGEASLVSGAVVADGARVVLRAGEHRFVVDGQALLSMEPLRADFRETAAKTTPQEMLMQRRHFVVGTAVLATFVGTLLVTRGSVAIDTPRGAVVVRAGEAWTPGSAAAQPAMSSGVPPRAAKPSAMALEVTVVGEGLQPGGAASRKGVAQPNIEVRAYQQQGRELSGLPRWVELGVKPTDASGRARFDAAPGTCFVATRAEGWANASLSLTIASGRDLTTVELVLERGVVVEGRTAEARTGKVVTPATLTFTPGRGPAGEAVTLSVDALGRFRTPPLARGNWFLEGLAPGVGQTRTEVQVPFSGSLEVVFHGSGFVEGYARLQDGGPAAGATVMLVGDDALQTEAAASGAFSLEVASGVWAVQARLAQQVGVAPSLEVVSGKTSNIGVITLRDASSNVTGRVFAGDAGVRATVSVSPHRGDGEVARGESDGEGRYTIPLAPGVYDVSVEAAGSGMANEFGVHVEGVTRLDVHLGQGGKLEGEVVDSAGRLVPGTTVEVRFFSFEQRRVFSHDGRFAFSDLRPGMWTVRALDASERPSAVGISQVERAQTQRTKLVVAPRSVLEGTITWKCSGPSRPVEVEVSDRLSRERVRVEGNRFRVEIVPGNYQVSASTDDERCRSPEGPPLTLRAGATRSLALTLQPPAKALEVQVVDASGEPVPEVMVTWVDAAAPAVMQSISFSDERGVAVFAPRMQRSVPAELVALAVKSGRSATSAPLRVGQARAVLTLGTAGALELELRGLRSGARAQVELVALPSFSFQDAVVLTNPRARLDGLPAGRLRVTATAGEAVGEGEVEVAPGEVRPLVVTLVRGGSVTGRLVGPDGAPRFGWVGLLTPEGEETREGVPVDSTGRFVISPVPAGRWLLELKFPGAHPPPRPLTVEPGVALDLGDVLLDVGDAGVE